MGSATGRYLLMALLLAVLVTAALAWPLHARWGGAGLFALVLAGSLCVLGAVLGRLVGSLVARLNPGPDAGPQATQLATSVRLLLTLALSLPVFLAKLAATWPFSIGLLAHYLTQMVLEVFVSVREASQNHAPTGTPARQPQPEGNIPTGSESTSTGATSTADDGSGADTP